MRATRKKASVRPSLLLMLILALLMAALAAAPIALSQMTSGLEVVSKDVNPGEEVRAVLKITNSNFTGYRTDVLVTYSIYGPSGTLLKSESATFPVLDSRDIVLSLALPDGSPAGTYSFRAEVEYPDGTQDNRDSFTIAGQEDSSGLYVLTLAIVAAVVVIILISRRRK